MTHLEQQQRAYREAHQRLWPKPVPKPEPEPVSVVIQKNPVDKEIIKLQAKLIMDLRVQVALLTDELAALKEPCCPQEPPTPQPITMDHIKRVIAETYSITVMDLVSHRRTLPIVRPRQIAMHLCRRLTGHSYPSIAKHFSDRDHTTCLSADRKIEFLRVADPQFNAKLQELERKLKG